ncbi:MAG TPA: hypothetical protein VHV49_14010 [Pseudonocardiaceae bacterium]|nr:hypothetical protein [Pseudonocardiaceae bacterium]
MNDETRELLGVLAKLNQAVPSLVLGVLDNTLTPAKQAEFGELLVDAGQLLQEHAQERAKIIESTDCASTGRG